METLFKSWNMDIKDEREFIMKIGSHKQTPKTEIGEGKHGFYYHYCDDMKK